MELLEPDPFQRTRERRRHADVADAQESMHALRRPRMSRRVPVRWRHRPIHQRHRRFSAGALHRLRLLHYRLPVQHSQIQSGNQARVQVHALCRPRGRRAGAGMHQIVPNRVLAFRQQGRHEVPCGDTRQATSRSLQFFQCGRVRPAGRRRHGRNLCAARRVRAGKLWRTAEKSARAVDRETMEGSAEVAWKCGHGWRPDWIVRALFARRNPFLQAASFATVSGSASRTGSPDFLTSIYF